METAVLGGVNCASPRSRSCCVAKLPQKTRSAIWQMLRKRNGNQNLLLRGFSLPYRGHLCGAALTHGMSPGLQMGAVGFPAVVGV